MRGNNYILKSGITADDYSKIADGVMLYLKNNIPSKLIMWPRQKLINIVGNAINRELALDDSLLKLCNESSETPEPPPKPKVCQHKYRDYSWYMEYEAQHFPNGNKVLNYRIFEPYVCVVCHERYDACLEKGTISLNDKSLNDAVKSITDRYPKITNRAEIEDAINDDIHVDREYLKWADFVSGRSSISNRPITLTLEASKNVVEREDGREEETSEALQGQRGAVLGRTCLQG